MKNIKSVLALIMAVCLMMCLAVPAFATEVTSEATTGTEANQEAVTPEAGDIDIPLGTGDEVDGDETKDTTPETTAPHDHDHDHEGEDSTETTGADEEKMGVLQIVLIVVEVIASVALVAVVLMQSGKESGLSGALSGNSDSYLSKSGKSLDKTLAKATKWVALAWLVVTLLLVLLY